MSFSVQKSTHGETTYFQSIKSSETKEKQVVRGSGCLDGRRAEYLGKGLLFLTFACLTIVPLAMGIFLSQGCTRDKLSVPFSSGRCQVAGFFVGIGSITTLLIAIPGLFAVSIHYIGVRNGRK